MPIAAETTGAASAYSLSEYQVSTRAEQSSSLFMFCTFSAALRDLSPVDLELIPVQDLISRSAHDSPGRRK